MPLMQDPQYLLLSLIRHLFQSQPHKQIKCLDTGLDVQCRLREMIETLLKTAKKYFVKTKKVTFFFFKEPFFFFRFKNKSCSLTRFSFFLFFLSSKDRHWHSSKKRKTMELGCKQNNYDNRGKQTGKVSSLRMLKKMMTIRFFFFTDLMMIMLLPLPSTHLSLPRHKYKEHFYNNQSFCQQ